MEEAQNNKKIRKVFLDELPKRNGKNNQTDWMKCKNLSFKFQWDNMLGTIIILDVKREKKKTKLLLKYKDNEMWIDNGHLFNCQIAMLIGQKTYSYSYKIGDIINDNKRNIEITKLTRTQEYRAYEYKCLNCGYIGTITESHMADKRGCPVCCNKIVVKGINDIATTHPYLVKYFVNIEDAYKYSYGSDNKVLMRCPDCGFEKKLVIGIFVINGFCCPKCGDGISLANKIIFNILEQLLGLDNFQTEYSPKWCKYGLKNKLRQGRYDSYFKLNNKEYIVEMDGGFHNVNNKLSGQTKEESIFIDNEKDRFAREHNIEVIRINCDPSKFEYIKENILDSKLNEIFDLSSIDWDTTFKYTLTNKMKEACDLWNSGFRTKEIAKLFKLNTGTIVKYLNNGTKLNLCKYNGKQEIIKGSAKPVICITHNLEFSSVTECANELSKMFQKTFYISSISDVCIGKRKTHNKMKFKYI